MDINGLGPTPYSDLGVSFNASEAEINAAHGTAMCRITFDPFDPDPGAQQAMDTLWEAMNILGDEHLKRIYDICLRRVYGIDDPEWPAWKLLRVDKNATEDAAHEAFGFYMIPWHDSRYVKIPQMAFEHARDRLIARAKKHGIEPPNVAVAEARRETEQTEFERTAVPARALQAPETKGRPKTKDPKAPKTAKAAKGSKHPSAPKPLPKTLTEDAKVGKAKKEAKTKKTVKIAEAQTAAVCSKVPPQLQPAAAVPEAPEALQTAKN